MLLTLTLAKLTQTITFQSNVVYKFYLKGSKRKISFSYSLFSVCALGALGSRSYPVAPTQLNPSHTSELPRLAFLLFVVSY